MVHKEGGEAIIHTGEPVRISLGNICIEISCNDRDFLGKARIDYYPFLTSRQPDFWIKFDLRDRLKAYEVKNLLLNSRSYLEGKHFFTRPELLECHINWEETSLRVATEKQLFTAEVEYKLMNALLRGIYSGIFKRVRNILPDAYIIHGCGIVDKERSFLFTGRSGSGKTTIARLAGGRKVLNDEAVLIGRNEEGFYLSGTPFDGDVSSRCGATAHLSAIYFLRHDATVSLRQLTKTETYHRLLSQIFDTTPLFEIPGLESLSELADLSTAVVARVPSYELGFRPDSSFWEVI